MMTKDEEWTDWMWYKLWSRCLVSLAQSLTYIQDTWLCHSVTSCHYINWGNLNYKIYFRSWEGWWHRWGWDQESEYFWLWAEQTHCAIHEFFIREIADPILEFLGSIISFACGIQARLAGGQNILLARRIYYLLDLPCDKDIIWADWVWQLDISH